MGDVIPIHSRRTFTREDAERLLPVVRRITESAAARARSLNDELSFVPREEALHERLKGEIDLTVRRWAIKVSQLGCAPRGVWLVDFDSGNGWFSWRLGDEDLSHFHPCESAGLDMQQDGDRTPLA
ncbi:MAG TPA: DUF2203 family protein [bacterium]|nr:DUF2203 family protein [bacterium]